MVSGITATFITFIAQNPVIMAGQDYQFLPAGHALCARPAGPKITLLFPRLYIYIYICMCVRTYHVRNNYVTCTYIVAMRPYFSQLWQFRRLLCVAAMSSLPQLRLQDGYREAEAT